MTQPVIDPVIQPVTAFRGDSEQFVPLYEVIPNEKIGDTLYRVFGPYGLTFDGQLFALMDRLTNRLYAGGMWTLRRYANGALALIFDRDDEVEATPFNQNQVKCSYRAISLAANLMLYSRLCGIAFERGDTDYNEILHDQYHALRLAVFGGSSFILNEVGRLVEPADEYRVLFQANEEAKAVYLITD